MLPRSPFLGDSMKKNKNSSGGKWIQEAIKHKGALREELHVKKGKKIPAKKLKAAAKKKGKEGRRARLAETLSKLRKRK